MIEVIDGLVVNKDNIAKNLARTHGLIYSQRALLKLVACGLTREEAYKAVQDNAMWSWKTGQDFKELLLEDKLIASKIKRSEIEAIFDPKKVFKHINYIFKNAGLK